MSEKAEPSPSIHARWFAAVPFFLTLVVLAVSMQDFIQKKNVITQLRVNLPLPTRIALGLGQQLIEYYFLAMPLMFAVAWFHFAWACKSERRLVVASQVWLLLLALVLMCFVVSMHATFFAIRAAMRGA